MCAQIEQNPRQGVELYGTCGAPETLRECGRLCLCSVLTACLLVASLGVGAMRLMELLA